MKPFDNESTTQWLSFCFFHSYIKSHHCYRLNFSDIFFYIFVAHNDQSRKKYILSWKYNTNGKLVICTRGQWNDNKALKSTAWLGLDKLYGLLCFALHCLPLYCYCARNNNRQNLVMYANQVQGYIHIIFGALIHIWCVLSNVWHSKIPSLPPPSICFPGNRFRMKKVDRTTKFGKLRIFLQSKSI